MTPAHPVIERYLTQLEERLANLAPADRQAVMRDIRSHLAEATAASRPLDATLESLGPAETLARAYTVELMLNPRQHTRRRAAYLLKIAGLIAAGSIPTLMGLIVLGGMGSVLVAGGIIGIMAGVLDAFGNLPAWVQTSGMAPALTVAMGIGMALVGVALLFGFRRFVRFVAATWRQALPKLTS